MANFNVWMVVDESDIVGERAEYYGNLPAAETAAKKLNEMLDYRDSNRYTIIEMKVEN